MKLFGGFRLRFILIIAILMITLFITTQTISAAGHFQEGIIAPGEVVANDLYLNAPSIQIQGELKGMLVAIGDDVIIDSSAKLQNDALIVGRSVTIKDGAEIAGNIIIAAQNVEFSTHITRNLLVISATLDLSDFALVGQNLFFGGYHIKMQPGSQAANNVYVAAYQAIFSGMIERNLYLLSTALDLDGGVAGDVYLHIDPGQANEDAIRFWKPYLMRFQIPDSLSQPFMISDLAEIGGQIKYSGPFNSEQAFRDFEGSGPNEEGLDPSGSEANPSSAGKTPTFRRVVRMLRLLINLIFTTIITLWFFPVFIKNSAAQVASRPLKAAGIGLIGLITIPIGLFLLISLLIASTFLFGLFTLGGLGRSVIALVLLVILWVVVFFGILVMYVSKFIVSFWLGRRIISRFIDHHRPADLSAGLVGVTLFVLISAIPYIGWVISFGVTIIGLGAMWYVSQNQKWLPFLKWKS